MDIGWYQWYIGYFGVSNNTLKFVSVPRLGDTAKRGDSGGEPAHRAGGPARATPSSGDRRWAEGVLWELLGLQNANWTLVNVGITINQPFLSVYTTDLWWLGGWLTIAIPTLLEILVLDLQILRHLPYNLMVSGYFISNFSVLADQPMRWLIHVWLQNLQLDPHQSWDPYTPQMVWRCME